MPRGRVLAAAKKSVTGMVIIRASPRDYLCIRHQQWLRGIHRPGLPALPEIAESQRRHDRRTANVPGEDIARAHRQAQDITRQWLEAGWHPALTERWQDRHRRLAAAIPGPEAALADVITHPEMLAVARLLAKPSPPARPAPHRYDRCVIPYADPAALIDDPQVLRIAVTDNGEPLIDVRTITALAVDQSRAEVQQLSDNPFHVRASAAEKLTRAQAALPDGYQLQVKEGWRPVWVQQRLWNLCLDQLQASRPDLSPEQARRENARFVAPPDSAPPH